MTDRTWIPCREQMPPRDKMIDIIVGQERHTDVFFNGFATFFGEDEHWHKKKVSHWRLVPKLPEDVQAQEAWGGKVSNRCHDCGAHEGQLHQWGCDMEPCPFCGKQLITCDCAYEKVPTVDSGEYYEHGLTDEQDKMWRHLCQGKGRIPWIQYPTMCARCGQRWPDMFSVPDAEWGRYIEPRRQDKVLCEPCYLEIKALIDNRLMQQKGD